MATWNTDNPKTSNQILEDIPDIEENLQELHDVITAITNGTLGTTTAADFRGDALAAAVDVGGDALTFPTNNNGAAVFMLGDNGAGNNTMWMYLNAAPTGWKVSAEGADSVLAVKATAKSSGTADGDTASKLVDSGADFVTDAIAVGDCAYNTTDGTSALVTAVDDLNTLSLASDAFPDGDETYEVGSRFIDPGGTQADEGSWDFGDGLTAAGEAAHTHTVDIWATDKTGTILTEAATSRNRMYDSTAAGAAADWNTNATASTTSRGKEETTAAGSSHTHAISSTSVDRPVASIGKLYDLDTA